MVNNIANIILLLLLWPVAFSNSQAAAFISLLAWGLSLAKRPRLFAIDVFTVVLLGYTAIGWLTSDDFAQSFVVSQVSSYFVFLFVTRFLYTFREQVISFIICDLKKIHIFALIAFYTFAQLQTGYEYEVGTLEAILLLKIILDRNSRTYLIPVVLAYLFLMYLISTRSTPVAIAGIFFLCTFTLGNQAVRYSCLAVLIASPLLGVIFEGIDLVREWLSIDDNGEIRYEMIKGGNDLISATSAIFGVGIGTPFRSQDYPYDFLHPLLLDDQMVFQISNHNSLFDLFLRTGLVGYCYFVIHFIRPMQLLTIHSMDKYSYSLLGVATFSLFINAYLDSTKLSLPLALLVFGATASLNAPNGLKQVKVA